MKKRWDSEYSGFPFLLSNFFLFLESVLIYSLLKLQPIQSCSSYFHPSRPTQSVIKTAALVDRTFPNFYVCFVHEALFQWKG